MRHQFLAFAVTAAVCALGALGAFLHPAFRQQAPYTTAQVERAFATAGLPLERRSAGALATDDRRLTVTVLPQATRHASRTCLGGVRRAELWRANVGAVLACADAHPGDALRVSRALALLAR